MEAVNVVVICNGESVLDHLLGDIIDSLDIVIRIGNFKIKGYERYIGTKTDIIVNRFKQIPDLTYATEKTVYWSPHKLISNEPQIHLNALTELETDTIKNTIHIDTPTTGLITYFLIKKYIPNINKIYYHGMDFLKGGQYWNNKHSHSAISLQENVNHDSIKERVWFNNMLASNRILKLIDYR